VGMATYNHEGENKKRESLIQEELHREHSIECSIDIFKY